MKNFGTYAGLIKLTLLLVGVPLLAYALGVGKTVSLWKECRSNQTLIESSAAETSVVPATPQPATAKINVLKNGEILKSLTWAMQENEVTAERYSPYLIQSVNEMDFYAGEVVFEGSFTGLTRLLAAVEEFPQLGQVVSVDYRSVENPRKRLRELQMTLIVQQITAAGKNEE